MKRSKLVGGRERKKGLKRKEKQKNKERDGPSSERRAAPTLMASLGRQRVVVAFAALALAAQHDGSGQEEEGRGDQQEQAEASKNPHHLETDGKKICVEQQKEHTDNISSLLSVPQLHWSFGGSRLKQFTPDIPVFSKIF